MRETFDKILSSCGLIVPLTDDISNKLFEACAKFANAEDFYIHKFEELSFQYINNGTDIDLDLFISDNIGEDIMLPACVRHALTFFVLFTAIMDSPDDEKAALYSLSLQNTLIRMKNNSSQLRYKEYLVQMFYHYESYIQDCIKIANDYPRELIKSIFNNDEFTVSDLGTDDVEGLRYMALVSWNQELKTYVNELKEENPYIRVALFLEHYFNNLPHYGMPCDVKVLMNLCVTKSKVRPKLRHIMKQIEDTGLLFSDHESVESCVLLNMLYNENVDEIDMAFMNEYFSVKEFFVYLYHELMLDYKLKENGYFEV